MMPAEDACWRMVDMMGKPEPCGFDSRYSPKETVALCHHAFGFYFKRITKGGKKGSPSLKKKKKVGTGIDYFLQGRDLMRLECECAP